MIEEQGKLVGEILMRRWPILFRRDLLVKEIEVMIKEQGEAEVLYE